MTTRPTGHAIRRSPRSATRSRRTSPTGSSSARRSRSVSTAATSSTSGVGTPMRRRPGRGSATRSCASSRARRALWRSQRCGRWRAGSSTSTRRWRAYWPEFAAEDKGDIPVRWLLTHEAGLPAITQRMPRGSLSDWDAMTERARRAGAVVGAGHRARLSRRHIRSPDRRSVAARDGARLRRAHPRRARARRSASSCCMPLPRGARRAHRGSHRGALARRLVLRSAGTRKPRSVRWRSEILPTATTPRTA